MLFLKKKKKNIFYEEQEFMAADMKVWIEFCIAWGDVLHPPTVSHLQHNMLCGI